MKLVIVDYGVGNILSIENAVKRLGVSSVEVSREKKVLSEANGLILPGVGAFSTCTDKLKKNGLSEILTNLVIFKKKPILGICVGMQLMANSSKEGGEFKGLGWIPGKVLRINAKKNLPVPHVGWNEIRVTKPHEVFKKIVIGSHFYFDHSYHYSCNTKFVTATCKYGETLNVAINYKNIFGVQFHPEKSDLAGLRLIRGYLNWIKAC
ncbi:imidazole glycerol phosphate synthase subunit HisH [Pelagibacterales bacterium SAG-MED49]|nr:imidazole glycerol phosphate synthase subunit HisH [Pelagibacterales bacterium SAG-MED49]